MGKYKALENQLVSAKRRIQFLEINLKAVASERQELVLNPESEWSNEIRETLLQNLEKLQNKKVLEPEGKE